MSKNFKNWRRQEVENIFGLTFLEECELLENWLNMNIEVTQEEKDYLQPLQKKLLRFVDSWNEEELKLKFIAFILGLVDFDTVAYKSFADRNLTATLKGVNNISYEVAGRIDLMIAKGMYDPEKPYFFLHEYKREKGGTNDPIGQLLIEMITAQHLNQDEKPIYGAYVLGRSWFFLILHQKNYCISNAYIATKKDLFDIVRILKGAKNIINQLIGQ